MYKPDNNLVSLNLQLGPKCLLDSNDASYLQKKNFTGSPPNSLKYISTKNIEKQNNPSSKNSNLTSKENQSNIFLQNEEDDERTKSLILFILIILFLFVYTLN